jgi:integrase
MSRTRLRLAFQRLLAEAGLPRLRLHDLRHTMATLMLAQGEHPKIVSERLGHATVGITPSTPTATCSLGSKPLLPTASRRFSGAASAVPLTL